MRRRSRHCWGTILINAFQQRASGGSPSQGSQLSSPGDPCPWQPSVNPSRATIVFSKCGEVPALVHSGGALLAAGFTCTSRLPARVDPSDSVSAGGHCRRRRARTVARHRHASCETGARTTSPVTPSLRDCLASDRRGVRHGFASGCQFINSAVGRARL